MKKHAILFCFLLGLGALAARGQESNDAGALDALPELQHFADAEYPPRALRRGIEGSVLLELLVSVEGTVDSVRIIEGLWPSLDAAAVSAARQFRFTPATADGQPVPVYIQYEYVFSIREETRRIEEYVNFSGTLRVKGTREPIPNALVVVTFPEMVTDTTLIVPWPAYLARLGDFKGQFVEEDRLVTYSDSQGRFRLKSLPAGPFTVTFPNAGFESRSIDQNLGYSEHLNIEYWLTRTRYDEYEIVVYGKPEPKEVTRQTLELTEVERLPGFGGDALKVVQAVPGVARPSFSSGEVIVRGSGQEDTHYYLDGVPIPKLFHFGGLRSTYNSQVLSNIDLYPGGFNTRYGGCVGGVVEVTGRPGRDDRWNRMIDVNLLDATFLAEGPVSPKITLSLTGRRSYIANALSLVEGLLEDVDMAVVPYYWDGVARLDYRPNPRDHLFGTFFAANDKMEFVFEDEEQGSSEISAAKDRLYIQERFFRFIFGYDRQFTPYLRNELRLAYGGDWWDGQILGYTKYHFFGRWFSLRNQLSWKQNRSLTYNFGLDAGSFPVEYTVNSAGTADSDVKDTFTDLGAYINVEVHPTKKLLLIPGLRYDHYEEIEEGEPSYRFTAQYELTDRHRLKSAVGTYNQSPRPIGQSIDPEFGNPDLPPSVATHYTLGGDWRLNDRIFANLDLYYNTQDQIPNTTDSLSINFLPDMDARMYGLEIMLRHEASARFFGWVSYCLARSERRSPRKPESTIKGEWDSAAWFLSHYDQTHHIEALGSWKLGRDWGAGFRLRYVSGNPETPRLGYTSGQYEFNSDFGEYVDLKGNYRSERLDPFFQLDVRIDKKYVFKNWILSTYLDVQNLNYFFYNSPEMYIYNYDSSEREKIGGFILPTIGVRAEF